MSPNNLEPLDNILQAIGWTPMVKLNRVTRGIRTPVYAKAENLNPGGSVKDRIGVEIIEAAERRGELKAGGTVVEATSGNTGVGLALACAIKGYRCIFTIPDKMSTEKVRLLRALGAEVIVVPTAVAADHPEYYINKARAIVAATPGAIMADQHYNPANPEAHYRTTGPEIWEQTKGKVTHFVCAPGTGGTISGVGPLPEGEEPEGPRDRRRPRRLDLHGVRGDAQEGRGLPLQGRRDRGRQDPDLAPLRRDRRVGVRERRRGLPDRAPPDARGRASSRAAPPASTSRSRSTSRARWTIPARWSSPSSATPASATSRSCTTTTG